ncbi:MAG: S9 family peptidase, partial [Gammaproteobacteria bacterium]|nr:S9 family peptidase [Gammaproteobacteria bacterium]
MSINRRELLQGVTACTAAYVARNTAFAAGPAVPAAPVARVEVVKDTYFGETLSDPYRWMENDKDPDWLPFLKGQDAHTRAVLARIPGRETLLKRIEQLSGDTALTRRAARFGARLFFEQR